MKKYNIYGILALLIVLAVGLNGCEETVWPEVASVAKSDYLGIWKSQASREKTTYIRTQDLVTKDFSSEESTAVETVEMQFEFGLTRSGKMIEDSVKITSTVIDNGVAKTPVVKTGYYTIGETAGSDFTGKTVYINIWEKKTTIHSGFSNPVAEPYTTYTVVNKSATDMELKWVLYNQTAQNSAAYKVTLKK
jgi:hypothetical protein